MAYPWRQSDWSKATPAASPERLWTLAWAFVLILVSLLFIQDIFATRFTPWPSIRGMAVWGRDFANVYTSGQLALEGRLDLLYDLPAYAAYQDALFQSALRDHNYSYPPPTLLYTWAFALLPYPVALLSWLLLTGTAFAAPMAAWAVGRQSDNAFSMVFRVAIMPMFLFSGTFFPVSSLPAPLEDDGVEFVTRLRSEHLEARAPFALRTRRHEPEGTPRSRSPGSPLPHLE